MELKTEKLLLRFPNDEDVKSFEDFLKRNKDHLAPWENVLEKTAAEQLQIWVRDVEEGKAIRFFIYPLDEPGKVIGMINFTQIFRGPFQACYLGYKIDHAYQGKGYMHEALKAAIAYLFEKEKLHRIMSNFMPHNKRSAQLLLKLGFTVEGYAKNYLKINGEWQDHILTALSYEKWASGKSTNVKDDIKDVIENLNKWAH